MTFNPNNYLNITNKPDQKLICMMGLNVLEDEGLALEVGAHLKKITD